MKKKIIITLFILLLLAGGGTAAILIYRSHSRTSNPAPVYPVTDFVGNWYEQNSSLSGFVQASEEQNVYVGTNQVIKEVHVSLGDTVHVGDPLLTYDTQKLELHLETLKANLEVTKASLTMARNELRRLRRIRPVPDNYTPQKSAAEIAMEEAQEKLSQAETDLQSAELSEEAEAVNNCSDEFYEMIGQLMGLERPVPDPEIVPLINVPKKDEELDEKLKVKVQAYREELKNYEDARDSLLEQLKEKKQELDEAKAKYEELVEKLSKAYDKAMEAYEKAREAYDKEQEGKGSEEVYTRSQLNLMISEKEEDIKNYELEVKRQELDVKLEELSLKDSTVTAARDGVVTKLDISDENIGSGTPVLTVSGENSYTAVLNVDEWTYQNLAIGSEVSVLSYDTGMTYTGIITEKGLSPEENNYWGNGQTVSYYPVTVSIRDGEGLYSGAWVEATIDDSTNTEDRMNELVLPVWLVKQENGKYYVMKDENGKLVKKFISTGKKYNGEMIVVKSGVEATDRLAFPYLKNSVEGQSTKPAEIFELYNEMYK